LGASDLAPVDLSKEVLDGIEREWVVVAPEHGGCGRGAPVLLAHDAPADRSEHEDLTPAQVPLAVATAGRLRDLIEPGFGAVDHWEIHIDPGLDQ
jgi:hypothetical protein